MGIRWTGPYVTVYTLAAYEFLKHNSSRNVKNYAFLLVALAACAQQRPVVLAPVRMETPATAQRSGSVFETQRDDPFATTNRIDWPAPNRYRSSSGVPGPDYWQQRADYTITASLDTGTAQLNGSVQIRYTNNSPDTLRYVWVQVDQNLYRTGSKGSALFPADSRWGVRGFQGGYDLTDVRVNGTPVRPRINDTMVRLDLPTPLTSGGGKTTIAIKYSFRVPEHGSDRMGRDSTLFEIAQWYPRMAVYDDVRGWNADPYLGQGEFYLEYGDVDYSVTVPAGYTVAGSGVLQNPGEVLTAGQRGRLTAASRSSAVVQIITQPEAATAKTRAVAGTKTWRFRAQHVHDVAWAGAPDFRWDATSWNGVLAQAYYEFPKAGKAWEHAAEQTQWTIRQYSQLFFPYPYPQATSVAGPVGGMEYPMFVMVHYGNDDPASIFGTINHEHGHEWFPMIVGSNERRYAWMDEGFNTYLNAFAKEARYPGQNAYPGYLKNWGDAVTQGTQSPLMTAPDNIDASALAAIGYRKPAAVLLTLRNHVVGSDLFDTAFREYIRSWAFKHPTPGDFFRSIENSTGEDLSWFWRSFFYTTDVLDIGIDSVSTRTSEGQTFAVIALRRNTSIPFPVRLRVAYADGTTQDFSLPVNIWARGNRFDAVLPVRGPVTGVRLWPDPSVPDWNPSNDTWGNPPPANPAGPVTRE
ncbi:MAG TPA: M1 family metallopeptidase [Gemmatimonadaceae bacterium]|nr:M1 family metallopeptidase [Gemmatimonadaceae bacterium]